MSTPITGDQTLASTAVFRACRAWQNSLTPQLPRRDAAAAVGRAPMSSPSPFPGAGAGRDQSTLVALEARARPRLDVPSGPTSTTARSTKAPDRPPKLLAAVRREPAAIDDDRVVVGGRSMGGRMCSMVAGRPTASRRRRRSSASGLISYPLHPPGKPHNLRGKHRPTITVPCLFVHGTADPFGTPDELRRWGRRRSPAR